ncbi:CDP-alcohol phosphatidyltransferase family protein [Bergeyella cardium]|uniref:CDP-alcohol phosphatidyltransferase n=1 Tax=Bergeyella cardium TaxID=1585976 RepID=A0A6P1QVV2_9FLAO|nr:CDP-alcohol phosphatidyltransferase family protein [Bergeyella cardium]QHN65267.1 CDP-alcohol phosphatidyltransferase [Bergeyella cardium]WHE32841.1 CDP-alcohol phosphatidyltransferase family protein [Bergeyella cardium]WHF59494.1 CDP-alcohol phosphatidyltransferase family protein [Bergeyella cardium]
MDFITKNIANAFTLGNLLAGCIGAIHLLSGDYQTTALCIVISLVLDFFDGFIARATKSNSALGVQLDSLADMVSFGLVPGLTMYQMLSDLSCPCQYVKYFGLLITLFSCLRLAIFNIDDEQKYYFKGLNTPSNTIMIFGLYFAYRYTGAYGFLTENTQILIGITVLSSWLLISPIKMIAMKFKTIKPADNYPIVALFIGANIIVSIFGIRGIPMVIVYYILISILFQRQLK